MLVVFGASVVVAGLRLWLSFSVQNKDAHLFLLLLVAVEETSKSKRPRVLEADGGSTPGDDPCLESEAHTVGGNPRVPPTSGTSESTTTPTATVDAPKSGESEPRGAPPTAPRRQSSGKPAGAGEERIKKKTKKTQDTGTSELECDKPDYSGFVDDYEDELEEDRAWLSNAMESKSRNNKPPNIESASLWPKWNTKPIDEKYMVPLDPENDADMDFLDEMTHFYKSTNPQVTIDSLFHKLSDGRYAFRDLFIWPNFMQEQLDFSDPKEYHAELRNLGTYATDPEDPWGHEEEIPIPPDDNEPPKWVPGNHSTLHYRGKPLKRSKLWLQDKPVNEGLVRYLYTGWCRRVSAATRHVKSVESVNKAMQRLNQGFGLDSDDKFNHSIVTHYDDESDEIGAHTVRIAAFLTIVVHTLYLQVRSCHRTSSAPSRTAPTSWSSRQERMLANFPSPDEMCLGTPQPQSKSARWPEAPRPKRPSERITPLSPSARRNCNPAPR